MLILVGVLGLIVLGLAAFVGYLTHVVNHNADCALNRARQTDRRFDGVHGELNLIRVRLGGHDAHLEHVDTLASQAHGQTCLTDDRLDEFEMWADVARTDVLSRVEDAASGLVTAANVLRLMGAGAASQAVPDATTDTPDDARARASEIYAAMVADNNERIAAIQEERRAMQEAPGPATLDERHHDDDGPNHDV